MFGVSDHIKIVNCLVFSTKNEAFLLNFFLFSIKKIDFFDWFL